MSGWDEYGAGAGSGPEREPSEERGRAARSDGGTGATPPWAAAETQTGGTLPPPWATPPQGPTYPGSPAPTGPAYTGSPTPPYTLPPTSPPPAPRRRVGRVLGVIALV